MKSKPIGFTVTELLVVVVVIGILAAVVLPKFTKTIENYKAAEAEHMLEAVRNEQEARCELDGSYTANPEELGTWATDTSRYFNYSLQACGMSATRLDGDGYMLQIPLYEDGRICCEGCDTLNKDYLSCDELRSSLPTTCPCAAEGGTPPVPPGGGCEETPKPDTSCGCNNTGHYSATWNSDSCSWDIGTTCLGENTSGCGPHECSEAVKNAHTAGTTTTTDSAGCTVETTWTFTDFPDCKWEKTETKDCPTYKFEPENTYKSGYVAYPARWSGNTPVWGEPEYYVQTSEMASAFWAMSSGVGSGFTCKNPSRTDSEMQWAVCSDCSVRFQSGNVQSFPFCGGDKGVSMCDSCPDNKETCNKQCVDIVPGFASENMRSSARPSSPEVRPFRSSAQLVNYNGDQVFACTSCSNYSARNGNLCAGGFIAHDAVLFKCKLKE